MFNERKFHILLFCVAIMIGAGVLQYLMPGNSILDGGLVTAILLTIFLPSDRYTVFFAIASAALVIVSAVFEGIPADRPQAYIPHLFSLMVIGMTSIFIIYVKKLYLNLEAEKAQVKALFEYATEGIVLTDARGMIVLVNPAAASLFGYDPEELCGESVDILIPRRHIGAHKDQRDTFYTRPSSRAMGHGRELFARRKDGSEFPVEISLSHFVQKAQGFVIAFIVDITERKRAENDVRRMNGELEAKVGQRTLILREALGKLERSQEELHAALDKERQLNEIKSRFVSMASHEFRTPLSAVLSSAVLISKYRLESEQDKRDRHIGRIKDSVKHLNNLLEDFLSLGKLEEGVVRQELTEFPASDFLSELNEDIKLLIKSRQCFHIDCPEGFSIRSDRRLLRNILINLIGNAAKFSAEDGSIWLHMRPGVDGGLQFSVEDQGIGIPKEDQEHLFSSFFRGSNAVNIEGTGLGLHIVRRYVGMLGGTMHLESEIGKGTTVRVEVPASIS